MRVLLLRRQSFGGIKTHTDDLAASLTRFGIDAVAQDAESWIPNETSLEAGRKVTKQLKALGDGFDLVHAFGFRSAWACAEAWGGKEAWIYTAWDIPKTTHPLLMDKLLEAQRGVAVSRAVRDVIQSNGGGQLDVIYPGVREPATPVPDRDEAREALNIPPGAKVVFGMGRLERERGFGVLLDSMEYIWERNESAHLVLVGQGSQEKELREQRWKMSRPEQIKMTGPTTRPFDTMSVADLVVVPSTRAGFSMVGAQAMWMGLPVLFRDIGGLSEMAEGEISARYFVEDEELPRHIVESLSMPLSLDSIGNAARIRAENMFEMGYCAERIAQVYKDVLSE